MIGQARRRLRRSLEKNAPEVRALLTGRMPRFVTGLGRGGRLREVPVFVFHEVEPATLDAQFLHLRSNGYRTLEASELEAVSRCGITGERDVALTFDDATWTFWAYAFPMLKKHNLRAILFAIPGIVPEDSTAYTNLEDVWAGRCTREDVARRGKSQPMCTWRELELMQRSGLVDIQSHSLLHARVPVSPRLSDFLHPAFDTDSYGNVNVPLSSLDSPENPERALRLGAPVFESAPRSACRPRFKESPELVQAMIDYVEQRGGPAFFNRRGWRRELTALFSEWPAQHRGSFETAQEMESAVRMELVRSREILEERLSKEVRHFCYPWYAGSKTADRLAGEAGYQSVHYGLDISGPHGHADGMPYPVRRLSEEYLLRLPGHGRSSIWCIASIWTSRARNRINGGAW